MLRGWVITTPGISRMTMAVILDSGCRYIFTIKRIKPRKRINQCQTDGKYIAFLRCGNRQYRSMAKAVSREISIHFRRR